MSNTFDAQPEKRAIASDDQIEYSVSESSILSKRVVRERGMTLLIDSGRRDSCVLDHKICGGRV